MQIAFTSLMTYVSGATDEHEIAANNSVLLMYNMSAGQQGRS